MNVYEYGAAHPRTLLMFQCTAEPWWALEPAAKCLARDFHVFLAAAEGHDPAEQSDFVSVEKYVDDAVRYVKDKGIDRLDAVYGLSIGGACALRLLAIRALPVGKAIVDAGITPYPYPKWLCRLIAVRDYLMIRLVTGSMWMMKLASPPERWTPPGEDPEEHYRKIFDFEKHHYSRKTIWNSFWSANNYAMPDPIPRVETEIEYWYGEEEQRARKADIAYVCRAFPQIALRRMDGMAHGELAMVYPERFYAEAMRFLGGKGENR